jgi:UDP-N-acetylmuramoyl-L-alanyl-D-glutamate--2,6-diaminopimelate ligase
MRELRLVGVTGTNGKTTTAAFLAALLSTPEKPVPRVTTVGAYLGNEPLRVPLDYPGMVEALRRGREAGAQDGVLEVTSEVLARGFARAWPIQIGVFTNLSHDHLNSHGSPEHYFASKAQLFVFLRRQGLAVINGCDPVADLLKQVVPAGVPVITYGAASRGLAVLPLDVTLAQVEVRWEGTSVRCVVEPVSERAEEGASHPLAGVPRVFEFQLRAVGELYAENALAALSCALGMGVPLERAQSVLSGLEAPPGRFEVLARHPHVVVDYAHSPDALTRTLATARRLCEGQLRLVFGAGGDRDREKRPLMGKAAAAADVVYLTSDNPRSENPASIADDVARGIPAGVRVVREPDRARAIEAALRDAGPPDVVLIAGKGHETTQIIGATACHFSDREVVQAVLAR